MAVYLRAIFAPGIRVVGCIPSLWRGHGRQGMQRLIVLSYVLAGTNVSSVDRLVTVLEPKALIRAPTMRSAKLDRRSANREVPWTLEAPVSATCQAAFSLTPFAVSKHRLPLVARSSTNIIDQRAQRAYLSIHQSTNSHGQSRSGNNNSQLCNALNLKAQPSPPAVPTRQSSESNRTAQHIVHTSSRPQTASPAESNRTAFPSRATGSPLFPACLALRPSSSPSERHSAQSAHCPGISAVYQRTIAPLSTSIRKFRLFSRPPTVTSITSPRTARLSHLSKHFPRSQHPLPFPIYRQFPLFA